METCTYRSCKKCGENKPLKQFPINNTLKSGILRKHTCSSCRYEQSKARVRLHKQHKRPSSLICPICQKQADKIVLDHNHETGEFRGWLCNDCNNALGKFNDDIEILQKAINYLSKDDV
jgi:protein-arginine kinase activator protein McsA